MSAYAGQTLALLTQHGKEAAIAPVLEPALGCTLRRVDGFDTDTLGTFTRETPRAGTQLEAARRKARLAIELSGLPIGLGSEGSFGPDPFTGMAPWNIEMLCLLDDRLGIEVVGWAQGAGRSAHALVGKWPELVDFADRAGFPDHALVLRPQAEDDARVRKGLAGWEALREAFDACRADAGACAARGRTNASARIAASATRRDTRSAILERAASVSPAHRWRGRTRSRTVPTRSPTTAALALRARTRA